MQTFDPMRLPLIRPHVRWTVHDDPRSFQRDKSATNHFVQVGEQTLNGLLGLHYFNDDGKVERETEHPLRVDDAAGTETGNTTQHCGARQALLPEELQESFIQRFSAESVTLADENTHQ